MCCCDLNLALGTLVFKERDNGEVVKKVEANSGVAGHRRPLDIVVVKLDLVEAQNVFVDKLESTIKVIGGSNQEEESDHQGSGGIEDYVEYERRYVRE